MLLIEGLRSLQRPTYLQTPIGVHHHQLRSLDLVGQLNIYPSSTMVAEVGGTLGLFLGVSFMTVWDGVIWMRENFGFFRSLLPDNIIKKEKN